MQAVFRIAANLMNDNKKARNMAAPPEIRLKRFLHYGNEEAEYIPGTKELKADKLKSIDAFIEKGKATDPVNHIVKVCIGLSFYLLIFRILLSL